MKVSLTSFKPHLLCSAAMFVLISLMILEKSQLGRALLLVPVLALFVAFEILYGLELSPVAAKKKSAAVQKTQL